MPGILLSKAHVQPGDAVGALPECGAASGALPEQGGAVGALSEQGGAAGALSEQGGAAGALLELDYVVGALPEPDNTARARLELECSARSPPDEGFPRGGGEEAPLDVDALEVAATQERVLLTRVGHMLLQWRKRWQLSVAMQAWAEHAQCLRRARRLASVRSSEACELQEGEGEKGAHQLQAPHADYASPVGLRDDCLSDAAVDVPDPALEVAYAIQRVRTAEGERWQQRRMLQGALRKWADNGRAHQASRAAVMQAKRSRWTKVLRHMHTRRLRQAVQEWAAVGEWARWRVAELVRAQARRREQRALARWMEDWREARRRPTAGLRHHQLHQMQTAVRRWRVEAFKALQRRGTVETITVLALARLQDRPHLPILAPPASPSNVRSGHPALRHIELRLRAATKARAVRGAWSAWYGLRALRNIEQRLRWKSEQRVAGWVLRELGAHAATLRSRRASLAHGLARHRERMVLAMLTGWQRACWRARDLRRFSAVLAQIGAGRHVETRKEALSTALHV
eukprot:gene7793-9260_t